MRLFIQSMVWNGWQLVEETGDYLLFKRGEGESKVSVGLFAPFASVALEKA